VEVKLLLFLRELTECRERDKDEPSVDATCEEPGRLSGPLRLMSSRLAAGDGPNMQITRKGSRKEGADGPSAACGESMS